MNISSSATSRHRARRLGVVQLALCAVVSGAWAAEELTPGHVAGPPAAEDMLNLPDSRWVLVSGVSIGPDADPGIYAVSDRPPHLEKLDFSIQAPSAGSDCPSALESNEFSPLGMAWRNAGDTRELLVINRADARKAVETFAVTDGRAPGLEWRDCVPLPSNVSANSIAPHPGGSFLVTQSHDPGDEQVGETAAG